MTRVQMAMKLSSVRRHLPTRAAVAAASNGKKPGAPCTTFPFFPQTVAATAPVDAQTLASPGETLPLHFTARLGEELLAGRERGGAMAAAYLFPKSDGRDWPAAPIAGLPGTQPFRPRTTHCELTERSRERAPWPEPAFPGCPLPLLPFFPAARNRGVVPPGSAGFRRRTHEGATAALSATVLHPRIQDPRVNGAQESEENI